jgi:hypothetical protein
MDWPNHRTLNAVMHTYGKEVYNQSNMGVKDKVLFDIPARENIF